MSETDNTEYTWTVSREYHLPRTVEDYKASTHFMERLKYRTDPEPSKEIVHDVLEYGTVKDTHLPQRLIFEQEIGDNIWWVLIEVNEDAFEQENKYHTLLTVYCKNSDHEKHPTVFDQ